MSTGLSTKEIIGKLKEIGTRLGFEVSEEVEARESYWIDVVWFDKRIPIYWFKKQRRKSPVRLTDSLLLPIVGFEIHESFSRKHIKGSIKNLEVLNAPIGCLVLSSNKLNPTDLRVIKSLARDSTSRIVVLPDNELERIYSSKILTVPNRQIVNTKPIENE